VAADTAGIATPSGDAAAPAAPGRRGSPVATNLVAIEGIDKAGKTTLAGALETELRHRGLRVARHREPSDGLLGTTFRRLSAISAVSPLAMALMSAADRADQQAQLLELCEGHDLVIADRYYVSGLAYHAADGVDGGYYQYLNAAMIRPALYLFLQVAPTVAARRYQDGEHPDRWERTAVARALPASYEQALARVTVDDHAHIIRLDANQPAAAVFADALAAITRHLFANVRKEDLP
jgi:dTMP kinase